MTTTRQLRFVATASDRSGGTVTDAATGEPVPGVWATDLHLEAGRPPTAAVHLRVVEVDVTTDRVRWYGLDAVPIDALRAELARREAAGVTG